MLGTDTKYNVGQLVWARMKGRPAWPGQVMDVNNLPPTVISHQKPDAYPISFFGDNKSGWVNASSLEDFDLGYHKYANQHATKAWRDGVDAAKELWDRRLSLQPIPNHIPIDLLLIGPNYWDPLFEALEGPGAPRLHPLGCQKFTPAFPEPPLGASGAAWAVPPMDVLSEVRVAAVEKVEGAAALSWLRRAAKAVDVHSLYEELQTLTSTSSTLTTKLTIEQSHVTTLQAEVASLQNQLNQHTLLHNHELSMLRDQNRVRVLELEGELGRKREELALVDEAIGRSRVVMKDALMQASRDGLDKVQLEYELQKTRTHNTQLQHALQEANRKLLVQEQLDSEDAGKWRARMATLASELMQRTLCTAWPEAAQHDAREVVQQMLALTQQEHAPSLQDIAPVAVKLISLLNCTLSSSSPPPSETIQHDDQRGLSERKELGEADQRAILATARGLLSVM